MHHVVSTKDFTRDAILRMIDLAEVLRGESRHTVRQRVAGAVVATLFYEPSTRTRLSFEAGVTRLGGRVITAENARENSSAKKGETLHDVFRVVGSYVDAIVIRHHETNAIAQAVGVSPVPVINGGDGAGEHPTQALLDVYTLWRELGRVDGLHLVVMGDLKYGRTVHSLLKMLVFFENVEVTLLHPDSLGLPDYLVEELMASNVVLRRGSDLQSALKDCDAVYQTRVQRERLSSPEEGRSASDYVIRPQHLEWLPAHARILHPLPRVDEIAADVDNDDRAAYFRQVANGMYIRMALMDEILRGVVR